MWHACYAVFVILTAISVALMALDAWVYQEWQLISRKKSEWNRAVWLIADATRGATEGYYSGRPRKRTRINADGAVSVSSPALRARRRRRPGCGRRGAVSPAGC